MEVWQDKELSVIPEVDMLHQVRNTAALINALLISHAIETVINSFRYA